MSRTRHGRYEVTLDFDNPDDIPLSETSYAGISLGDEDVSMSIASASIISNLPGPGRTVGNMVSKLGRRIEHSLNLGPRSESLRPSHLTLCFDDARDLLVFSQSSAVIQHGEAVMLYPASVSTASNIPGPGRTADKLLSFLGRKFEGLLSSAGERIGLGPSRVARRIRPRPSQLFHCVRCGQWMYWSPHYFGSTSGGEPFSVDIVNWIFQAACTECRPAHIEALSQDHRLCKTLVKALRSKNIVSLHQTITYVATLISLHPNFNATFSSLGVTSALEDLYQRWGRYRDTDSLLARSHRVLQFVGEDKVLHRSARLQEIDLGFTGDVWSDGLKADALIHQYRCTLIELLHFTLDPHLGSLAAMQVMLATVHNTWRYSRMTNLCSIFTPLIDRWWYSVACGDTIVSKMLFHIYGNVTDIDSELVWKTMLIPALRTLVLPGRNYTTVVDFEAVDVLISRYIDTSSFRLEMSADITQALRDIQSQAAGHAGVAGWCEQLLSPYFKWYAEVKQEMSERRSDLTVMIRRDRYVQICTELGSMLPQANTQILRKLEDTVDGFLNILRVRTLSVEEQANFEDLLEHLSDCQWPDSLESRTSRERTLLEFLDSAVPAAVPSRISKPFVLYIRRLPETATGDDSNLVLREILVSSWIARSDPRTEELHCGCTEDYLRWLPISDYDALAHSYALMTISVHEECILSTEDGGELQYYVVGQATLTEHVTVFGDNDFHVLGICRSRAKDVHWN